MESVSIKLRYSKSNNALTEITHWGFSVCLFKSGKLTQKELLNGRTNELLITCEIQFAIAGSNSGFDWDQKGRELFVK